MTRFYIAGPMRGHPEYNFPAFDECEAWLTEWKFEAVSPAAHDRSNGFDPGSGDLTDFDMAEAIKWDLCQVVDAHCVVLLPGWRDSEGARIEYALARMLRKPVYEFVEPDYYPNPNARLRYLPVDGDEPDDVEPDGEVVVDDEPDDVEPDGDDDDANWEDDDSNLIAWWRAAADEALVNAEAEYGPPDITESVCAEADRLVSGDRQDSYGHPADDFTRTGRLWGAILGVDDVPPHLVGLCMVAVKLSRETHRPKRDNLVDICGYAKTVDMVRERQRQQIAGRVGES